MMTTDLFPGAASTAPGAPALFPRVRALLRWPREHPFAVDRVLAGLAAAFAVLTWIASSASTPDGPFGTPRLTLLATIGALQTIPLALRRSRPLLALVLPAVASFAQLFVTDGPIPSNLFWPVTIYSASRWAKNEQTRFLSLALIVLSAPAAVRDWSDADSSTLALGMSSAFLGVILVALWVIGEVLRRRALYIARLRTQHDALVRDREQRDQLAAQQERTRIAREMHDVVAHGLAVIVVQADGAAYAAHHAPSWERAEAEEALATIARAARDSLTEARRLVAVLRSPEQPDDAGSAAVPDGTTADYAPVGGIEQIGHLVERISGAGRDIALAWEPGTDFGEVPREVGSAAYRIVQESLTNILKHADPAARTTVLLIRRPGEVVVRVEDDGGQRAAAARDERGSGLIGMRERAAALGGTFSAGPRTGGGWLVTATLPLVGARS